MRSTTAGTTATATAGTTATATTTTTTTKTTETPSEPQLLVSSVMSGDKS